MSKAMICGAALAMVGAATSAAEPAARLAGAPGEPALLVRHEPGPGPSVLYVHGATFPSGLSVAYRIDGRSWMDDLRARGFDVWAFDFAGYGGSERPAAMAAGATRPVGRAGEAVGQIERVVRHALAATGKPRLSIVAHSWGTIPAGLFAGQHPELVDRLVLFGPVAARDGTASEAPTAAAHPISADDQWQSFQSGVPTSEISPIAPETFAAWAETYLATDPDSASRTPPAVLVPTGPQADFADAWAGRLPYDPAAVRAPTLIVRGEWDDITRDADAAWLKRALSKVPGGALDVKLPRGAHRMHLEGNRQALFDAVGAFLGRTGRMVAVMFEVRTAPGQREAYLDIAAALRPELERIDGFISIERFASLSDDGKLLSLSFWRDEDAVAAWRRFAEHRAAQRDGRAGIFADYRLRVASVVRDYGMFDRAEVPADLRTAPENRVDPR